MFIYFNNAQRSLWKRGSTYTLIKGSAYHLWGKYIVRGYLKNESNILLYEFETNWTIVPNSTVYPSQNLVGANITSFGIFAPLSEEGSLLLQLMVGLMAFLILMVLVSQVLNGTIGIKELVIGLIVTGVVVSVVISLIGLVWGR